MNECLNDIRRRMPAFSPTEKKIARCILETPETVLNETVTHFAARAGVASGSVANFAAVMGFRGFTDMKIRIAQSLERSPQPVFDGVTQDDAPREAMQKLMQSASASFQDTLSGMDDSLLRAADMLMQAERIEIYASGSSLPVGYDVHYRLMRLGMPSAFQPDALLASMSASQLHPGAVALCISHKGRTANTLDAAETARRRGAKLIALTSRPDSPLAKISDVCLTSVSAEAEADREAVVSRLTQLLIMDSLCAYIAAQRGSEAMRYLDSEIETLEHYRK